ncbi:MAG: MoaD/ThiS family protein [Nannocystaceae bacterium]|nr:MoaD/ThiS family protein [Myxococcales bacterium]
MARVVFTRNLQRYVDTTPRTLPGASVREVLGRLFEQLPAARSYLLDDQGAVRKHVVLFINGAQLEDRVGLSDPVADDAEIYVMQALSGG